MSKIQDVMEVGKTSCRERTEIESAFFNYLSRISLDFTSDLQMGFEVSSAIESLEVYFENVSDLETVELDGRFAAQYWNSLFLGFEYGMNTPGILWDRLTILVCKLVLASSFSRHSTSPSAVLGDEVMTQINGVLEVLHNSMPAKTVLLAKEQTARVSEAQSLSKSLLKLLQSNLGMWINQDLLYSKDADLVPSSRLNSYIIFFGRYNSKRNSSIEEIDLLYRRRFGV